MKFDDVVSNTIDRVFGLTARLGLGRMRLVRATGLRDYDRGVRNEASKANQECPAPVGFDRDDRKKDRRFLLLAVSDRWNSD